MQTFLVLSSAGPNRDLLKGTREQPLWDEHAAFIDGLVEAGFILLGGPLVDVGGAVLVVTAESERMARDMIATDPWYRHGILHLESVQRWQIFIDQRAGSI